MLLNVHADPGSDSEADEATDGQRNTWGHVAGDNEHVYERLDWSNLRKQESNG